MEHIRTITSTYATMRSTAADLRGDFIAFLSDLQGTRGSMLMWDWNTSTCLRFFLKSKVDLSHDSLASSDGDAPLVVAPPYIIYIRTYPLTLHILPIPTDLLQPLDSYDLMQRPHLTLPTWSMYLPWEVIDTPSDIRCTLLEHDGENRVVVQIDMCRSRRASSCKLVLAKGVSTQCIGNEDVRFDFDAHLEDVADHPKPLSIGECGISGTTEWFNTLTPHEVDNLLKKVLRLPEFSGSDSSDGIDRRLYCTERELQWNVAFDPMLGRMAVISTPKQRGIYLVDIQ
ncbi:hypothetical protein C8Q75DRAFT_538431 [Abortiporus biennis]|nr:hypothetical protein C8Q75DRAFT_538431 [Abortiporus biennis]